MSKYYNTMMSWWPGGDVVWCRLPPTLYGRMHTSASCCKFPESISWFTPNQLILFFIFPLFLSFFSFLFLCLHILIYILSTLYIYNPTAALHQHSTWIINYFSHIFYLYFRNKSAIFSVIYIIILLLWTHAQHFCSAIQELPKKVRTELKRILQTENRS